MIRLLDIASVLALVLAVVTDTMYRSNAAARKLELFISIPKRGLALGHPRHPVTTTTPLRLHSFPVVVPYGVGRWVREVCGG